MRENVAGDEAQNRQRNKSMKAGRLHYTRFHSHGMFWLVNGVHCFSETP
jgi:hypothetical protein